MTYKFKIMTIQKMADRAPRTSKKIIDTQNIVTSIHKTFTQVRPQKSGAAGYQYSLGHNNFSEILKYNKIE